MFPSVAGDKCRLLLVKRIGMPAFEAGKIIYAAIESQSLERQNRKSEIWLRGVLEYRRIPSELLLRNFLDRSVEQGHTQATGSSHHNLMRVP